MFDLLIGLGLAFLLLRLAERLPERRPIPVPVRDIHGKRGRR